MALDSAGVSDISMEEILFNDVQEYLVEEAVIIGTIINLTNRVTKGMKSLKVPRFSGLTVSAVKQDGTCAVAGGMTADQDTLNLNIFNEVPEYIYECADLESAVDLKQQFLDAAPRVLADQIEQDIYNELKAGVSAATPDHILQMSETAVDGTVNGAPSLKDIQSAGLLLDKKKVPKTDRYLLVSPSVRVHLLCKAEIQDASKSGTNSAIVNGEFARLFGFTMIESCNVGDYEAVAYHRTALAFAMHKEIEFIEEQDRACGREFISVRTKYGVKHLDQGCRAVLLNETGA